MRLFLALLATAFCTPALAADPGESLPQVVVTATRVPTPDTDIPAGVTVIDRKTIETRGYNTLVDALEAVPGLRVSSSGGPGGNASVFIRGTNSDHVLVLRDGMPINDAADSSGAFNFGVDTLADVERIEIIRGPMAALYGSGAIGGVINLITRRGTRPGMHWEGDLSGGYPAQIRGSAVASGVEGPVDYALIFESQSRRGYDTTPQRESVYTGTPQGFRDRVATLNLGYTVIPGTRLSLLLRARKSIFGFNELGAPTFDDSNASGTDASLLGRIGVASSLFGGSYQTSVFLGREQDDRRYYEPLNLADPNLATIDDRYHSYRTDLQWNNTVHLNDFFSSTALSATDLTFGYEHTTDTAHVRTNDNYAGYPYGQGANASMTDDAVYLGLQSMVWHRLTLTGQVRQDWEAPNAPTTWRVGAVFDVPEIDTHFKAAYGTAFRAPSLFDRYGVDSFGYAGNPNLKAESAQGWEAGFTTTLPAWRRPDFITFGATWFNEQVNNLIVAVDTATVNTAENVGSAHIQGVETDLTLHPAGWLAVQASWTYTDAEDADTGSALLRRPRHAASLNATISPLPRLTIAPELLFTGAFQDYLVDNNGFSTADIVGSPHGLIANITVTYDVAPRVQLYANGTNLFGSRFEPVNGYQTPGPTFLAGVRLRL
ncbi:MAG TPA: TonB-dependent receptor [Acetobacteraceae bacterium]|nr:TonB-dependent receptor [Acetobacteraceae bacterium]